MDLWENWKERIATKEETRPIEHWMLSSYREEDDGYRVFPTGADQPLKRMGPVGPGSAVRIFSISHSNVVATESLLGYLCFAQKCSQSSNLLIT